MVDIEEDVLLFSETAHKVFSKEFQAFLHILTSTCIEDEKLKKEAEELCIMIGKALEGKNIRSGLLALLFHVLSISSYSQIKDSVDRIHEIQKNRDKSEKDRLNYIG